MSDLWYCEDDGSPVGPLTLFDLKTRLSRTPDANSVLVWREGMANWRTAGEVPELVPALPRPPRAASSPQLMPGATKSKSKIASFISSSAIIVLLVGGLRFLNDMNRTVASVDESSKKISEDARNSFVKAGEETCLKKQQAESDSNSLAIPRGRLIDYCSCYMNTLADVITYGDLKAAPKDGPFPPWLQSKADAADKPCFDQFRKALLGG